MTEYTQAIAVDSDFRYTLLIRRNNNPGKGKLSGIGGHIEDGESPEDCMAREWEEEVGLPAPGKFVPIMTQVLADCTNHMFGIIIPDIDIYFSHNDADGEGLIRWHHILGERIMDVDNNDVAWGGLIPCCIKLLEGMK
jgi:8-oxo-dGTP diphosphatase